jgi:hypothetical protein
MSSQAASDDIAAFQSRPAFIKAHADQMAHFAAAVSHDVV